jgi:tRNA (guanine37-N1)-methyltransferase
LRKTQALTVPKLKAQSVIQQLRKLQLINDELQLEKMKDNIVIPLLREPTGHELLSVKELVGEVIPHEASFSERNLSPRNLMEALQATIPPELLSMLPNSFDIVGDIGVVELTPELEPFAGAVGNGIMRINPRLRLVLKKSGSVSGVHRTRKFQPIAGSGNTETTYHEFSCIYRLDVALVYFNARLSHERMRVAEQVEPDETVVDMFAGVGPYSILIARQQPQVRVYSIDINANAFKYLKQNVMLNKVADKVIPIQGDSSIIISNQLRRTATRVIMNLPADAGSFLGDALNALGESGGIVHFYAFRSRSDNIDELKDEICKFANRHGRKVDAFLFHKAIREVAPNRVQVALDIRIR